MNETAATSGSRRFRVVQFEFPWELGPQDGRYTIREHLGEAPGHVLVLRTLGAHERRLLARRRGRSRPPQAPPADPAPEPVATTRATLIDTDAIVGYEAASSWLAGADVEALAQSALDRLNRVLHAHRIAAADPYAREVALRQALVVRVGFGDGERVAEGRLDRARELPRATAGRRRSRAAAALRPQERLAALLAGRDAALACEELALRVRLDVDAQRWREAALGLRSALDAALAELEPWRDAAQLAQRLEELRTHGDDVAAVAASALQGGLADEQIALVQAVLPRLEAALRARVAAAR